MPPTRRSSVIALLFFAVVPLGAPRAQKTDTALLERLSLFEATIADIQGALESGLVTSEQVTGAYLRRIAAYDDFLNAYLRVNENALAEARARDLDRRAGRAYGPLFGIPVLLKDNVDVTGIPTSAGSVALRASFPPDDAFLVQRLRDAGAIILGKATLTEFANFMTNGMPNGYSSWGGFGFNPYDPRENAAGLPILSPGGSSSGPAIGVAANLTSVAIGTETSGSILSPGSQNGIVGIKPTLGLVSRDGILPITADQDTAGPLTRTVADAAILLSAIAGYDPADPATEPCLQPGNCFDDYTPFLDPNGLAGVRIAVPKAPYWQGLNMNHRRILRRAIMNLRDEGATVVEPYEIPGQNQLNQIGICISHPAPPNCSTVLLYGFKKDLNDYLASLGPSAPRQSMAEIIAFNNSLPELALAFGQSLLREADEIDTAPTSSDTQRYLADRQRDLDVFRGALDAVYAGPDGVPGNEDDFDAILFPSNRGANAPARAGYPSIVVPGGFLPATNNRPQRPFGVTFSGPAFSEPTLIAIAYAFERTTGFREAPRMFPPLPSDELPMTPAKNAR